MDNVRACGAVCTGVRRAGFSILVCTKANSRLLSSFAFSCHIHDPSTPCGILPPDNEVHTKYIMHLAMELATQYSLLGLLDQTYQRLYIDGRTTVALPIFGHAFMFSSDSKTLHRAARYVNIMLLPSL